jgi:hypothetical protein
MNRFHPAAVLLPQSCKDFIGRFRRLGVFAVSYYKLLEEYVPSPCLISLPSIVSSTFVGE